MSAQGFKIRDDWTSLTAGLVFSDQNPKKLVGYVFIKDLSKSKPLWKIAGGGKEAGETPILTAVRELEEETGLVIPPQRFKQIAKEHLWKDNHWSLLFATRITESELKMMCGNHPRNEGEVPMFFSLEEYQEMLNRGDFLYSHIKKIETISVLYLDII